jgi:hypothetical protein
MASILRRINVIFVLYGKVFHLTKPKHFPEDTTSFFFWYHNYDECCFGLGYSDTTHSGIRETEEAMGLLSYSRGIEKEQKGN